MTRDQWMDEVERITEQFCAEELSLDEAVRKLQRIGLDTHEARDLLQEAAA